MSRPGVFVRMEPELLADIDQRVAGTVIEGRNGFARGRAEYVRRLVYDDLGYELPEQHDDHSELERVQPPITYSPQPADAPGQPEFVPPPVKRQGLAGLSATCAAISKAVQVKPPPSTEPTLEELGAAIVDLKRSNTWPEMPQALTLRYPSIALSVDAIRAKYRRHVARHETERT